MKPKLNSQYRIITALLLVALLIPVGQVKAEGNWWDKGRDILQKLPTQNTATGPTLGEMGAAFKEALRIGAENVVTRLGGVDGFNADPAVHIPLPKELTTVKTILTRAGMSQSVDDLELKLNRAAEAATPKAQALFVDSIKTMTFADIKKIYDGPDDSATRYFQAKMSPSLSREMSPIVQNSLSQVGAVQAYDNVIGSYKTLPFVPDVKANLTNHVVQKGMEGIFYYLAKEEADIRKNPAKRTTELLKKVFGAK